MANMARSRRSRSTLLRRQFETNVFGAVRLSQLVLPGCGGPDVGRIVNVSSVAGRVSIMGGGAYHASKFALEALADAMRPEVEPFGVAVVNVLPGPIATHFEATLMKTIPECGDDSPYASFKAESRPADARVPDARAASAS